MSNNQNYNDFGSGGRYGPPQSYGPPKQVYGQQQFPNPTQPAPNYYSQNPYAYAPQQYPQAYADKSMVLAYVCWFFLGGIGLHKFYLRQYKLGISYAVFTFLNVFCVLFLQFGGPFGLVLAVALIIDLFTIPGRVRAVNEGRATDTFNLTEK